MNAYLIRTRQKKVPFDTAPNVRTEKKECKTTDMSRTYLDVICAEKSGLGQ